MGFFSDLKEDLSQAVNELMPEDALDAGQAGGPEMDMMPDEGQDMQDAPVAEDVPDTVNSFDISSMLDKLDEAGVSDEIPEEDVSVPDIPVEAAENLFGTEAINEAPAEEAAAVFSGEPAEEEIMEMPEDAAEFPEEAAELSEEEPITESFEEEYIPEAEREEEQPAEPAAETEMEMDDTVLQLDEEEEENMDIQTSRVAVDETAVVTEGMTITGDIVSHGSMELIGTVNGNLDIYGKLNITGNIQGNSKAAEIYAEGAKIAGEVNSDGSVKIGQSSVVIGNISATSAVIAGAVKGDIDVHGPVILDTTAIVMGNIKSKSVQINNGAVIEGLCSQCYADINPSTFFEEFKKKK